jgi:hypothetical protein
VFSLGNYLQEEFRSPLSLRKTLEVRVDKGLELVAIKDVISIGNEML